MTNPDLISEMTSWVARAEKFGILNRLQFSVVSTRKARPYILVTDGRTSISLRSSPGTVTSRWGKQVLDHFGIQTQ